MMKKIYKNILIIKMSSLGDVIHAIPAVVALRELYTTARITWIVEPGFAGLIPLGSIVDEIIFFEKSQLKSQGCLGKLKFLRALRQKLHSHKFDLVIDFQGLFKSSLVALLSGCNNRIGYCEMREGSFLVTKSIVGENSQAHVIERYLDVTRYLGSTVQQGKFVLPDLTIEEQWLQKSLQVKNFQRQYVVFAPGTSWLTKEWPIEHYINLAKNLISDGYAIIIVGGKNDIDKGQAIAEKLPQEFVLDLTGVTSLKELAMVIKNSLIYISGDTGPLHIAVATGAKIIALYGPTKPKRTGPYGDNAIVLQADIPCQYCLKKTCDDIKCMREITVDKVYQIAYDTIKEIKNAFTISK